MHSDFQQIYFGVVFSLAPEFGIILGAECELPEEGLTIGLGAV